MALIRRAVSVPLGCKTPPTVLPIACLFMFVEEPGFLKKLGFFC
jgi:hypothetical protein